MMSNKNSLVLFENVPDQLTQDLRQHMAIGIVLSNWTIVKFQNEIAI